MSTNEKSDRIDRAFLAVWQQSVVDRAKIVKVEGNSYSVRRTPKRGLVEVDFEIEGQPLRGLEQNPETKSRWAQMARKGSKVMQFLSAGRYLAVVADGKITHYGSRK